MDLQQPLGELVTSQLIRRLEEMDLAYLFKHALVQDTAYASLLKNDRKRLHRLIGESLERAYPDALNENAARLAQHFSEAGDDAKAFEYATRAGDADARLYANAEVIMHYSNALEAARRLDEQGAPVSCEILRHLYSARGRAYELTSRYAEAHENYLEMERVAQARSDSGLKLAGLVARSKLYATFTPLHDAPRARSTAEEALALARQQNDRAAEATILWSLMLVAVYGEGNVRLALDYGEQALTIARALNLPEQTAYILNDLYYPYLATHNLDEPLKITKEAQELWRRLGNQPMLVDSLGSSTLIHFLRGEFQTAVDTGNEAFHLAQQSNNYWGESYALMYLGQVLFKRGEPTAALDLMNECIRLGPLGEFYPPLVNVRANMGWTYAQLGAFAQGIAFGEQAMTVAHDKLPFFAPWAAADLVRCYLAAGDAARAHRLLDEQLRAEQVEFSVVPMIVITQRAMAIAEYLRTQNEHERAHALLEKEKVELAQRGARAYIPEILSLQARLWLDESKLEQAEAALLQARTAAAQLGSRWDLHQIYIALFETATRRGDASAANEWRVLARDEIEYIAAHTPQELRETFLNLPRVGQVANGVRNKLVLQK